MWLYYHLFNGSTIDGYLGLLSLKCKVTWPWNKMHLKRNLRDHTKFFPWSYNWSWGGGGKMSHKTPNDVYYCFEYWGSLDPCIWMRNFLFFACLFPLLRAVEVCSETFKIILHRLVHRFWIFCVYLGNYTRHLFPQYWSKELKFLCPIFPLPFFISYFPKRLKWVIVSISLRFFFKLCFQKGRW